MKLYYGNVCLHTWNWSLGMGEGYKGLCISSSLLLHNSYLFFTIPTHTIFTYLITSVYIQYFVMYGFSFKTILKSFFTEGPLNKLKKRIRSPPLTESYEDSTGLSSMITIRPVDVKSFVSLDSCEYCFVA